MNKNTSSGKKGKQGIKHRDNQQTLVGGFSNEFPDSCSRNRSLAQACLLRAGSIYKEVLPSEGTFP